MRLVRCWRAAIDHAKEGLVDIKPWVDDEDQLPLNWFTSKLRNSLRSMGGIVNRTNIGDVPDFESEPPAQFSELTTQINERLQELLSIAPRSASRGHMSQSENVAFDQPREPPPADREQDVSALLDEDAYHSPSKLAKTFGVGLNALNQRLKRWRRENFDGFIENADRRAREPLYLYKLSAVRHLIDALQESQVD